MVSLLANDGGRVIISEDAAKKSSVIADFMEMFDGADVPVPGAGAETLIKIAEFCEFISQKRTDAEVSSFEYGFYDAEVDTLAEIANVANYLDIPELVDGVCEAIADTMRGKTAYQIQEIFGTGEMSPQEMEEVRLSHPWAFET